MPFDEEDLDPHGECAHEIARLQQAKRESEIALTVVRSLTHNLPRSATADKIDQVCADALGEARTP